ncbi:hypothetical protein PDESU_04189 [Pontiella desulfatans]|uniref:Polysaccharide pyruvyl transferase domain-containing protein n=1 Tax=Pontiella desulfatans TaxID=2750659 RepID=A0A6C2U854_PONDE|nr:polysaccharide pyruvyl transferase family protein [Pontiella desulfatans]VGO15604.1 hypothetical protein PDESU_04189 [Pontiella desulfatans]
MKICIVGWYGTETIGDRAILAGIIQLLAESFPDFEVELGSLIPFFSERMLHEDADLWAKLAGRTVKLHMFDSTSMTGLRRAVGESDLVLVGGGPLMDLRSMHVLSYAFAYARKRGKRTGVFGCGAGPLKTAEYRKVTADILSNADFAVFRDRASLDFVEEQGLCAAGTFKSAICPAAFCAMHFREEYPPVRGAERICVNLRRMPDGYLDGAPERIDEATERLVLSLAQRFPEKEVVLTPNHYFAMGNDDRVLLNGIRFRSDAGNLTVRNKPLSLEGTMRFFADSCFCVGMRFHSFLLMSIVNGRCILLNYTGENEGKTAGFIRDYDTAGFFDSRHMIQLCESASLDGISFFESSSELFGLDAGLLETARSVYRNELTGLWQ